MSLIKLREPNQKHATPVSQLDIAIGRAEVTRDLLCAQVLQMEGKVHELLVSARKAKNRNEALSYLRFP